MSLPSYEFFSCRLDFINVENKKEGELFYFYSLLSLGVKRDVRIQRSVQNLSVLIGELKRFVFGVATAEYYGYLGSLLYTYRGFVGRDERLFRRRSRLFPVTTLRRHGHRR